MFWPQLRPEDLKVMRVQLYARETGKWQRFAVGAAGIAVGKPFAFSVDVGPKIAVTIDGKAVVEAEYGKRMMRGTWSVAKNGGPVWLQDLRIEPLAPARK